MKTLPIDLQKWEAVCKNAYQLDQCPLIAGGLSAQLFLSPTRRNSPYASTAPYLTDGGLTQVDKHIDVNAFSTALHDFIQHHKAKYVLLKTRTNYFEGTPKTKIDKQYRTFGIDLKQGAQHLWENVIHKTNRTQIRKAWRLNPEIKSGGIERVDDFYAVFSRTQRELGTPVHSRDFFNAILASFGTSATIFIGYLGGKPVSAFLAVQHGTSVHQPYSGTLKQYRSTCISSAVFWESLQYACEHQADYMDIGRSPLTSGSCAYKTSWGAEAIALYYTYFLKEAGSKPFDQQSPLIALATTSWKKIPLPLTQFLGPHFIKYIL